MTNGSVALPVGARPTPSAGTRCRRVAGHGPSSCFVRACYVEPVQTIDLLARATSPASSPSAPPGWSEAAGARARADDAIEAEPLTPRARSPPRCRGPLPDGPARAQASPTRHRDLSSADGLTPEAALQRGSAGHAGASSPGMVAASPAASRPSSAPAPGLGASAQVALAGECGIVVELLRWPASPTARRGP